jgi:flagellum-specific ATP synthase
MSGHPFAVAMTGLSPARRVGFVRKVGPAHVEASGPLSTIGDICEIAQDGSSVLAEVVAVGADHVILAPLYREMAIMPGARVVAQPMRSSAPVGKAFGGRAVGAMGEPIDGGPPILGEGFAALAGEVMAPMARKAPDVILETGVRAIDGLLTIGRGQRLGLFSASGVGKTTLMTQLALNVTADRCVICLVGERGREVEAFWRTISARPDHERFTCVAATSDLSAPLRVRAVHQALALGEHWRDRGEDVLLVVDSVTRFAMALREIGLAAGAPPTLRAYTPNVFAALPRLVERCGAARSGGSITAVMTVLSETDDVDDPIVEIMKSLLDGHIVLSRQLAEQGHFPPIDVLRSVSRQAAMLMAPAHAAAARLTLSLMATYEDARLMIDTGVYKPGANARIDEAVRDRERIMTFLRQRTDERSAFSETLRRLSSPATERARA